VVHEVGGEEDGRAFAGELGDQVIEEVGGFDVEAVGGLVKDEELGLVEDGEEKAELFLHASGVLLGVVVDVFGEAEAADDGGEALHGSGGVEAVHGGGEFEDLTAREVGVEDGLVGEETDEALADTRSSKASRLSTQTWPLVALRMPMRSRKRVVLPAPLGPRRPQIWPEGTEKVMSLRACLSGPKDLVTWFTTTRPGWGVGRISGLIRERNRVWDWRRL